MGRKFDLSLMLVVLLLVGSAYAFSGDGEGTADNPYNISNCLELNETRDNLTAYYQLTTNIDCSDTINWNDGAGFEPMATIWAFPFAGTLDGNNFNITDLYINRSSTDVGLFRYLSGIVNNIGIVDANITGSSGGIITTSLSGIINHSFVTGDIVGDQNIGLLAGTMTASGEILNSHAFGTIIGTTYVGGLVAQKYGIVNNSYAIVNITAEDYVGGLVGYNEGPVENSYTAGNIDSTDAEVGGLIGENYGAVTNCSSSSNVNTTEDYAGGLVGYNYGNISSSFATGDVSGEGYAMGGLIGYFSEGVVTSSYATGNVVAEYSAGGLVGETNSFQLIDSCYATGNVTTTDSADAYAGGLVGDSSTGNISNSFSTGNVNGTGSYVGGLVGRNSGPISNSYSTGIVSGEDYVGGLVGWDSGGIVLNAYAKGNVYATGGTATVGGLIGMFVGDDYVYYINYTFATGNVSGGEYSGGLVGVMDGGLILDSYWYNSTANSELNCYSEGDNGCVSKTSLSYFYTSSNAPMNSWNFADIWDNTCSGYDSPYLQWENRYSSVTECPNYVAPEIEEDEPQTSSSSSSSSGGGSTSSQTYYGDEELPTEGNNFGLRVGDRIKFEARQGNHTLTLLGYDWGSAKAKIESNPIYVTLEKGKLYEFDLTGDATNDVQVHYDGIDEVNRKALLYIKEITTQPKAEVLVTGKDVTEEKTSVGNVPNESVSQTSSIEPFHKGSSWTWLWIIATVVVIALLVWLLIPKKKGKVWNKKWKPKHGKRK